MSILEALRFFSGSIIVLLDCFLMVLRQFRMGRSTKTVPAKFD
jgi:hypothetical protein